jgi:DNA-binding response OmpR family regulator
MRVLVVEDERKVAEALREGLEDEHHDVVIERTGDDAFFRASTETFDVVLLDVGLPGRNGLEVLRALRQQRIDVRVIVVTARDDLGARVAGLDAGADDYVIKPFALAELLARIRAVCRRGRAAEMRRFTVGEVTVDVITRKVTRAGLDVDLTIREFELLAYLMRHEGAVLSRENIVREVWREQQRSARLDNVIDVHIARLRRKVDADDQPRLIHTIRGVGYMVREGDG